MKKALPALALIGAACTVPVGPVGASSVPARSILSLSPTTIANLSLAGARAKGTCTDASKGAAVGYTFGSTTNSGTSEARETSYFNSSTGTVLLIKGKLFIHESAELISVQFGKADPAAANKWISIPSANKDYQSFASGLLFSSMITQVRPSGTLRKSGVQTIDGVKVVAVIGAANAEMGLAKGVESLFVSTSAPYLPVELRASGRTQGVPTTLTVTFSHWGHHFTYSSPHGAIPLAATTLP